MFFNPFKNFSKIHKESKELKSKVTHEQERISKEHERLLIEYEKAKAQYKSRN